MTELNEWDSFYVIIGSAAGALIGLQFVVMTLVAERPPLRGAEVGAAFATPTIIHFSAVLLLSALLRVPWQSVTAISIVWGLMGLGGFIYTIMVTLHIQRQTTYRPVFEDWLFHVLLPSVAYTLLVISAWKASSYLREALFGIGAAALVLLFVGIHNAWDAVAYHVLVNRQDAKTVEQKEHAVVNRK